MTEPEPMTEAELDAISSRAGAASPAPWRSWIEARDDHCGADFIQIVLGDEQVDMYVSYSFMTKPNLVPASAGDLDFIAHARQDVPRLVAEVRRLRSLL